jgi:hypothetical protein
MKVAFERGEVLKVVKPFFVDGEMVMPGDRVELLRADALSLKARRMAVPDDDQRAAKPSAKAKAA